MSYNIVLNVFAASAPVKRPNRLYLSLSFYHFYCIHTRVKTSLKRPAVFATSLTLDREAIIYLSTSLSDR